jgi:hypothetical protein
MSVNPKNIDFGAATKEAAKKVLPNTNVSGGGTGKIDFAAATEQGLKKKVEQPSKEPSEPLLPGAEAPTSELPSSDLDKPFNFNIDYKKLAEKQSQSQPEPSKSFSDTDKEQLNSLLVKHGTGGDPMAAIRKNVGLFNVPEIETKSLKPFQKEYDESAALEKNLQGKLAAAMDKMGDRDVEVGGQYPKPVKEILDDLNKVQDIKKKAWREIVQLGHDKIDAVVRRDESGNLLNKTFNRLLATSPSAGVIGGARISQETIDRIHKLPKQFATGLNYLEGVEPEEYKRIVDALQKGLPISESQIANIVNQGIDIEADRLKRQAATLPKEEVQKREKELVKTREDNILNNQEVLRAFISEGVAEYGDIIGKATNINSQPGKEAADYLLGHTWNYSDSEIKDWGEKYLKQNGFDPTDARVQY